MPGSVINAILPLAITVAGAWFGGPYGAIAASMVASALFKPKAPSQPDGPSSAGQSAQLVTSRQPAAPWQRIYGQTRVGGIITYMEAVNVGAPNNVLHIVITLAGHVVEEIGDVYFDDELLTIDGSGMVTGRYIEPSNGASYAYVYKSKGDEAGQPFPELVAESAGLWTDAHRQTGRAKIHVRLTQNQSLFRNGVPNITVVVKGKKVYDPRTALTVYSANWALCVADYLCDAQVGVGAVYADEVNDAQLISAANVCDEDVALAAGGTENRFEMHGSFDTSGTPGDILGQLLTAGAGKVAYVAGTWYVFPASYATPTVTLTVDDLRGPVHIQPRLSRRDLCNGVKGTYVSPDNHWQASDFPPVTNATYLTEDQGERIWRDLDLPFTRSASAAQRIAKIELERTRQQVILNLQCKLTAWQVQPGDVVMVTLPRYGYAAKTFEVMETTLVHEQDDGGGTRLGVDLVLRETASAVFSWSSGEETAVDPAPDSNLPDPFSGVDVTLGTPESGTNQLFVAGDGTVQARVMIPVTSVMSSFVEEFEVQFARSAGSPQEWQDAPRAKMPVSRVYAYPVDDGAAYDFRVRAKTTIGSLGAWAYIHGYTVVGKTQPPSDVSTFSVAQQGSLVLFVASTVEDPDLDSIEIRYGEQTNTWDQASQVGNILRGQEMTTASIPPGPWRFFAKAKDTTGNYSTNSLSQDVTVTSTFIDIVATSFAPAWNGALVNLVRHWTGVVTIRSQSLASALGWEVFDQFVPDPYATGYFESGEIDKLVNAFARIWTDAVSLLGPGESSGIAQTGVQIETRLAAGSYAGFVDWTLGTLNFRYIKARMTVDTGVGNVVVSTFDLTVDNDERTEHGEGVAVGAGGTPIAYATAFHITPNLQVTNSGTPARIAGYTGNSASGATLRTFDTTGAGAAGTVDWKATGV